MDEAQCEKKRVLIYRIVLYGNIRGDCFRHELVNWAVSFLKMLMLWQPQKRVDLQTLPRTSDDVCS